MAHNIVYHSRREFNHAGIDLKDHGNQAMWSELRRAFLEHQVIAILGQDLSPDDQMNVGRFFAEPCFYPFAKGMETMLNGVIGSCAITRKPARNVPADGGARASALGGFTQRANEPKEIA